MIVTNEKAIEILTNVQKYCKDKTWCNSCLLGRDTCNELFGDGEIPSGWELKNNTEKEGRKEYENEI